MDSYRAIEGVSNGGGFEAPGFERRLRAIGAESAMYGAAEGFPAPYERIWSQDYFNWHLFF